MILTDQPVNINRLTYDRAEYSLLRERVAIISLLCLRTILTCNLFSTGNSQ